MYSRYFKKNNRIYFEKFNLAVRQLNKKSYKKKYYFQCMDQIKI